MIIPESWAGVTVDQYQRIVKLEKNDIIGLFSILCNVNYKLLHDLVDPYVENNLIRCTSFVQDQSFKTGSIPTWMHINGRDIKVPKVDGLTIGQSIHIRQKLEEVEMYEQTISLATACYLQPLYDQEEFDYESALELEKEILKMPITEIYPLGFFLLNQMMSGGGNIFGQWSRTFTDWFHISMIRGNNLVRWPRLPVSTDSSTLTLSETSQNDLD